MPSSLQGVNHVIRSVGTKHAPIDDIISRTTSETCRFLYLYLSRSGTYGNHCGVLPSIKGLD